MGKKLESIIVDVRKRDLSELKQDVDNANIGDTDAITESMERWGIFDVLVVDDESDIILAGNHRYQSMLEGGISEHWAVMVKPKKRSDAEGISLASNQTAHRSKWDDTRLTQRLERLGSTKGTGFTDFDIKKIKERVQADIDGTTPSLRMVTCPECQHTFDPKAQ